MSASARARKRDEEDAVPDTARRADPGKLTTAELREDPSLGHAAGPGKLTLSDVGRDDMSPAEAIAYSRWMCAQDRGIDRRAEGINAEVDDGSLASAFSFLEESRAGQTLPTELAARLAAELGVDLSRLRVHTDDRAAEAAATLRARAFTIGDDIYFAAGAYDPTSDAGVELIAHEAAHVAQNQRGTAPRGRKVSRPDDAHERQADEFAHRFSRRVQHKLDRNDPASLVEHVRREARQVELPFLTEIEQQLGTDLGAVQAFTGDAAAVACQLMAAGAFAIRNIVAFADPSPKRETLLHELTHVVQTGTLRAPTRFAAGSLKISNPHDDVEVEARSGTARPTAHADADTIHRDDSATSGTGTGDDGNPEKRFEEFLTSWIKAPANYLKEDQDNFDKLKFGYLAEVADAQPAAEGEPATDKKIYDPRYKISTNKSFSFSTYEADSPKWTNYKGKAKQNDLSVVYKSKGAQVGLTKVGDAESHTWAWIDPSQPYRTHVVDMHVEARSKPDPHKQWREYTLWCEKLGYDLTITIGTKSLKPDAKAGQTGHAYTLSEAAAFRGALVSKIVENFKPQGGEWKLFYDTIVTKEPFKLNTGLVGNAFEKLVLQSIAPDSARPHFDHTAPARLRTADGELLNYQAKGDKFAIVADCKAYNLEVGSNGKPVANKKLSADLQSQADDYAKVVGVGGGTKLPGYDKKGGAKVNQREFNHVLYIFPTKEVAAQWNDALLKTFKDTEWYSLAPWPNSTDFHFSINPTFQVELKDQKKSHHKVSNPPVSHPGMVVRELDVNLKQAGSPELASGYVVMDVDMAGALKDDKVRKPLKPAADGAAPTVENKFPGLKSKTLEKLLKRVDVDAKLTDEGVEAKIEIKKGSSGIPNFELDGATITAKYGGAGLAVSGEIGISHKSGKIAGKIKASWNGADWNFEGEATVSEGLIDGLKSFTLKVKYENGDWSVGCDNVEYEKQLKAVKLTGTAYGVWYNIKKGTFNGMVGLKADLGMFGTASADAEIDDNKLKKLTLEYDSPELKYPKGKDPASFTGTVGGTLTYEDGKFSGRIRGTANLNIPALKSIAGEGGLGLAVDGHVKADGSYSGTIATTKPLKFGRHFEVPSIACTLEEDGSVKGAFEVKVVDFKYLESAKIACKVDKDGVHLDKAELKAKIGKPDDKFWGSVSVAYDEAKGLKIGGEVFVKLKEGMIAHGALTYDTEKNVVDVTLGMEEVELFNKQIKKSIFKIKKQIPLVSFYQLIGIYLDLGFELSFDFDFNLKMKPELKLEGLSLDTFEYTKISAEIALLGQLSAKLIGTPNLGVGLFALSPSILRGGGGLKMPVVGEALIKPSGKFKVGYKPGGEVEGDASVGMMMTFGIRASVMPYAELSVLDDMWNPSWTGDALADFEILKPKELFNFTVDFGKPQKQEEPKLPEENASKDPAPPTAAKQVAEEKGATKEAAASAPTTTTDPAETGDEGPFSLSAIKPMLAKLPGYSTVTKLLDKAAAAYKMISELLGRILKVIIDFFGEIIEKIEAILDGFAKEGLAFMPKMVRLLLGDTLYDIVEPVVLAVAKSAEEIISLFETDPPKSATDIFPWALKLMGKVWGIAFNGIRALASALWTMLERLAAAAKKLANYMVQEGMIGVQRHSYYIWKPIGPNYYFVAATQYKIHILGFDDEFAEDGMITNPRSVVGLVLFEVLEALDVPPTSDFYDSDAGESLRDRWVGPGGGVSLGEKMEEMMAKMKADQAAAKAQQKEATDLPETPQRKAKPGSGLEPVMTRPPKL